jgi:mannose-6-phosphate isomerase
MGRVPMPLPAPCLLERKILPKVWGGRALASLFSFDLPDGAAIGETWEVYDRPDGASRVRGSDLTLRDLMQADAQAILGRARPTAAGYFPLLLKFIDAAERLSVQVHPDDEQAACEGDGGKNEAWVVLHVGENPSILRGFRAPVTPEAFAAVAHQPAVIEFLQAFTPAVGDVIHVPAGTVHAIGPDVVLYEIQQNSDLTYRLYDWGRPRELHLAQGLRAARFDAAPQTTVAPQRCDETMEWLLRDPHFTVRRLRTAEGVAVATDEHCLLLTLVEGRCAVGWRGDPLPEPLLMQPGDTALVPAWVPAVSLSPIGCVTMLLSQPRAGR